MMGTANRWYHKYKESERLLVLKSAIEIYDERNEHSNHNVSDIGVIDWELIEMYLTGVKPFESASTLLGGDTYPAACIVIPMIDQLHHDLESCRVVRPADGKEFVKNLFGTKFINIQLSPPFRSSSSTIIFGRPPTSPWSYKS